MRAVVTLVALAGCLTLSGCGKGPAVNEKPLPLEKTGLETGDYLIGEPVRFANLTIFPVTSKAPHTEDRFITLDEGLKSGEVEIVEIGGGEAPNAPAINADELFNQSLPAEQPGLPEDGIDLVPQNPGSSETPAPAEEAPDIELDAAPKQCEEEPIAQQQTGNPQVIVLDQVLQNAEHYPQQGQQAAGGASVNTLMVVNRSDRPLYLMPGELIIGGQQDRTIGRELVIQPTGQPTPIEVFCVEQGRWGGRGADATVEYLANAASSDGLSETVAFSGGNIELAEKAIDQQKFVASIGNLNKAARLAVQGAKNQGEVWSKVQEFNTKNGTQTDSSTFTANYGSVHSVEKLEPYLENLKDPIAQRKQVVGVIVAINGKVESMDVFESTPLFLKLWPKLLKSYALDAANSLDHEKAHEAIASSAAREFFTNAMQAEVKETETGDDKQIAVTTRQAEDVVSFAADLQVEEAAPAAAYGGAVHASAYAQ